jgi:hypothetical protein
LSEAGTRAGDAWVRAIAAGDEAALLDVLDPSVDFRALTPGGDWAASASADAGAIVLGRWFADPRRIEGVEWVDHAEVGERHRTGYRFSATTPDGAAVVEQQACFDVVAGRITWLRILCTGFHVTAPPTDP